MTLNKGLKDLGEAKQKFYDELGKTDLAIKIVACTKRLNEGLRDASKRLDELAEQLRSKQK